MAETTARPAPPPTEVAALAAAAVALDGAGPDAVLDWLFARYDDGIVLASAFGNTSDVVLMDMVARRRPGAEVFYLDTGFLFPETYALIERARAHWPQLALRRYAPALTPAAQAAAHGDALWSRDPDRCCDIRKVQPIEEALAGRRAWITGVRRDQSPARAGTPPVQWDAKFGLAKANPLVNWSEREAWAYIFAHDVPYHPLHDQGFPTLGCTHCTRAVAPGEDQRAGRWSGTGKTECGLHAD
jgi:phosphoadenosine phosphosulfate reductase